MTTRTMTALLMAGMCILPTISHAEYIIHGEGKKQPFCEAIVKALNKSNPTFSTLPCISYVVLNMPGVTDPPWEKLDIDKYESLVKEILTNRTVGDSEYFSNPRQRPKQWPTAEQLQKQWLQVKEDKEELFVLREPHYEDMVRLTLRQPKARCGSDRAEVGETALGAWASPDLKHLHNADPNNSPYRPLKYKGRMYYVNLNGSLGELDMKAKDQPYGSESLMCDIRFDPKGNHQ